MRKPAAVPVRLPALCLKRFAVTCFVICAAFAAGAQTIRIPDFRNPPTAAATYKPGEPCENCGRILAIREKSVQRKPNVPQPFQGGGPGASSSPGADRNLVGAVVYLPLGGDSGEKPFVGGVGTPEMRERFQDTTYEITVRLDDGAVRFLERHDGTRYRIGDRVRLPGAGQIELLAE
ncbi:MAG: hypothetical protein IT529_22525 [Burkholderiales bacterium]|nr:hypothetical protein [Burkholderiales bacterium]